MRLIIEPNYEQLSQWAANYVAAKIKKANPTAEKPFVLGLPTGSSPLGMYKHLIELNKQTRSSVETKRLLELDRQRDRLAAYILGVTARASELPDDEDRKLGEELYNELKVYEGIGKLPQDDETVTVGYDIYSPQGKGAFRMKNAKKF